MAPDSQAQPPHDEFAAFVKLSDQFEVDLDSLAQAHGLLILDRFDPAHISLLRSQGNIPVEQLLNALENIPEIEYAEPNYIMWNPEAQQKSEGFVDTGDPDWIPEEDQPESYFQQPAQSQLELSGAQKFLSGEGVTVAVIDNGIDFEHPVFSDCISFDPAPPWDFIDDDSDASEADSGEAHGHGTFVSSVIHMTAPGAKILPLRALNADGVGTSFAVAEAIYYATGADVDIVNLSVAMSVESEGVSEAISEAISNNVLIVCAAGNGDSSIPVYPAATDGVWAVTAVDSHDVKSVYANYGSWITISAPGDAIYAAMPDSSFGWWDGTSFAAGFVSGTLGLLRSGDVEVNNEYALELLSNTAQPVYDLNPEYVGDLGAGRLNVARAVSGLFGIQGIKGRRLMPEH
jgi:subtilisin family serine protease